MTRKNEFSRLWHQAVEADAWSNDIERARAALAELIVQVIADRWGTAIAAERATGIAHTEFSRIRNGKLGRYTVDRLARLLRMLDPSLEVRVDVKIKRRQARPKKTTGVSHYRAHDARSR